jgi:hypothetical protein
VVARSGARGRDGRGGAVILRRPAPELMTMVNMDRTCQELGCTGRMVFVETQPAGPFVAGDATSHVDVYACDSCGAEDWS